jgi:hypothetical protein
VLQNIQQIGIRIPITVLALVMGAAFGAFAAYLVLPCGAMAAGTGVNCAPEETFIADVGLSNAYINIPSLTVTVTGDESGSDQYVVYARNEGADDDSWVEIGRIAADASADASRDTISRPRWIEDGENYEYYVVGMENGEAGDYSNVVAHTAPPMPVVYRAFEKTGGYVVKWRTAETDQFLYYNSYYKLRTEFDWRSMRHAGTGYRRFEGLHLGRWYDFRIQSTSRQGRSDWVEARRMVPNRSTAAPASVRNFNAAVEDGSVKLSFDRYRDLTVVRFQVMQMFTPEGVTDGTSRMVIFDVWNEPDMENYVDESATEAGTYDYRMRAVNAYMEANDDRMNWDTWSTLATVTR